MSAKRAEIENVLGEYVLALDRREFERMAECFTETAVAEYDGVPKAEGLAAIIAHVARLERFLVTQHLLYPLTIDVTSESEARATTYGTAVLPTGGRATTRGLAYELALVLTVAGWRIDHLIQRALWSTDAPATRSPGSAFDEAGSR